MLASQLSQVFQRLSRAKGTQAVLSALRDAAREHTGADGVTVVLREAGLCHYVDESAIEPLWRGQRFPLEACISGWAMLNRTTAVIPDIYADPRIPHAAYRPTFVKSLVMVPIRSMDPIGAIGNYWADEHHATDGEVRHPRPVDLLDRHQVRLVLGVVAHHPRLRRVRHRLAVRGVAARRRRNRRR